MLLGCLNPEGTEMLLGSVLACILLKSIVTCGNYCTTQQHQQQLWPLHLHQSVMVLAGVLLLDHDMWYYILDKHPKV
jgi:hypothetical protein